MSRSKQSKSPASGTCPTTTPRRGQCFSEAVKRQALELVAQGVRRVEISRRLGMTTESIRHWAIAARAEGTSPRPPRVATSAPAPSLLAR